MGELRRRGGKWWIRWYRNGRRYEESSGSSKKEDARTLLRSREGDVAHGLPVTAKIGQLRFDEAATDVLADYRVNGKRSIDEVERRIEKHLRPFFGGRRMTSVTTADVRAYVAHRQGQTEIVKKAYTLRLRDGSTREVREQRRKMDGVSNAEINRELTILKRAFTLAVQARKQLHAPYIPLLREENTRTGFFEPEQYSGVMRHLPAALRPVVEFAYITGWRIDSEVLPLEWRHVDFRAGEVRLDAHTTKNGEGRVFPMTDDLRALLETQHAAYVDRTKAGHLVARVFVRDVAKGRRGPKAPRTITSFGKAWTTACRAAGCPGRLKHDLRRTAIRNMVRRGVPERVAMQLSGHKTRSVFERYNIVSEGDLRTAAMQLSGLTAKGDLHASEAVSRPSLASGLTSLPSA